MPEHSDNFLYAVDRTLTEEGVFSNVKADRGGKTKYGITEAVARRHKLVVEHITVQQAIAIYHADYWTPLQLDKVKNRYVAAEIFDTGVNMGTFRAVEIAQQAAWFFGAYTGKIDGLIGTKTIAALNELSGRYLRHLLYALNGFQFLRYYDICDDNAEQREAFFKGWMKRLALPKELAA